MKLQAKLHVFAEQKQALMPEDTILAEFLRNISISSYATNNSEGGDGVGTTSSDEAVANDENAGVGGSDEADDGADSGTEEEQVEDSKAQLKRLDQHRLTSRWNEDWKDLTREEIEHVQRKITETDWFKLEQGV